VSAQRPYIINTYDRWIILVIVMVGGWLLFRPVFAVVAAYRGVTFEASLLPDTAEHYYKKSISIDRSVPDGWIHLGELYYDWNRGDRARFEEAARTFQAGMRAVPTNARLPFDLGRTYLLKLHDYPRAEAALKEAVERDPQSEFGWDYLGYAAVKTGDRRYAIECWRRVLEIDPQHESARKAIARFGGR
jgi:tetratricopeptide (TPR) repeat protein